MLFSFENSHVMMYVHWMLTKLRSSCKDLALRWVSLFGNLRAFNEAKLKLVQYRRKIQKSF